MRAKTQLRAEREGLVPAGDMIAALGKFYLAILSALILAAAIMGVDGLANAISVLPIGNPALMAGFTA